MHIGNLSKKQKIIIISAVFVAVAIIGIILLNINKSNSNPTDAIKYTATTAESEGSTSLIQSDNSEKIMVHIKGAVTNPGVYEILSDARLKDVIELAGGLTGDANANIINLAMHLHDEDEIIIPVKSNTNDEKRNEVVVNNPSSSNSGIIKNPSTSSTTSSAASATAKPQITITAENKLNINTANSEYLQALPGIGEVYASNIIEYRTQNGNFVNIEDIKNVSGIGEKRFAAIKDLICTE